MKFSVYFAFLLFFPVFLMSQKPILYYKCGNYVRLGDIGLVSNKSGIKVEGATIFENPDSPDTLILVPSSRTIALSGISEQTKTDTTLWLKVVKPPAPQIVFTYNGKTVTGNKDIPVDEQDQDTLLFLQFIADSAFAAQCPRDSTYLFKGATLFIQFGLGEPLSFPFSRGKPSPRLAYTNSGTKHNSWIMLKEIVRVNIEGTKFVARVPEKYRVMKFNRD